MAQLTFALLLELASRVGANSEGVHAGRWSACEDFSYADSPLIELEGLTLGIVGYGRIGRRVSSIARAFGMEALIHTRTPPQTCPEGARFVDLDSLFSQADAVTLHCPLTKATEGLVDAARLSTMKSSAFLLNRARGPLIDEAALARALNEGVLAGAAVDVLSSEPPPPTHPLLGVRNCLITPHLGWATVAARRRMMAVAVANVRAFLDGRPQNVVGAG